MKNIAITGGGTGGHLSIAKALNIECQKRGICAIYIGSTNGQDIAWFGDSKNPCYFLQSSGVVNKRGFGLIKSLWWQFRAILKSRAIFKAHKIECVISVGGFSAGGASMAAILTHTPLFIHEQNAVFGMLNKILAPFARAVFGSFTLPCKNFIKTSYPIDENFAKTARVREKINIILFLGGSQGAMAINDFALKLAPNLLKRGIKIIHQCGNRDFSRVESAYRAILGDDFSDKITLFAFDKNLLSFINRADFCISRAGASSLWELASNALPCYFVPYPFAAKNHQFLNAQFLQKQGLCEVMAQKDLNAEAFLKYLDSVNFAQISANLKSLPHKNGAKEILDYILES